MNVSRRIASGSTLATGDSLLPDLPCDCCHTNTPSIIRLHPRGYNLRACTDCLRAGCLDPDKWESETITDWLCLSRIQEHTFERGWT